MLTKNQLVELEITGMSTDGNGVGRAEGIAVFIPYTAVGDRVLAKVVKVQKSYAFAIIQELLLTGPGRESDPSGGCPVYRRCGGCSFRHLTYTEELRCKREFVAGNMARLGGIQTPVEETLPSPLSERYRNKAQYPISLDERGRVVVGFYSKRSHRVQECLDCRLQPAFFADILKTAAAFLEERRIPIYNEERHQGLARHLYLRWGEATGSLMVCLVINGRHLPCSEEFVSRIRSVCPGSVSILLNVNTEKTNVILGRENILLYGEETITDLLCGVKVQLSPQSFYQVNRRAAQQLYRLAADMAGLTGKETLLDLYCGAGTIGLSMADRAAKLIGVEVVPQAVENARENAREAGRENARFLCADAGEAARQLEKEGVRPDVIVVDPPRKGCSAEVLEAMCSMAPERIVMISCNSATAARDCGLLQAMGFEVRRIVPCDLFPRTAHVECCILLTKKTDPA